MILRGEIGGGGFLRGEICAKRRLYSVKMHYTIVLHCLQRVSEGNMDRL